MIPYANYVKSAYTQTAIDPATGIPVNVLAQNTQAGDKVQLGSMPAAQAAAAGLGTAPPPRNPVQSDIDRVRQGTSQTRENQINEKNEAEAKARQAAEAAQAAKNVPAATPDKSMMQYLVNPTDNNYANYGIAGGLGALALGGLGGLFSSPKNRMRNALLYALLGGGLGLGAKYMADRYGVGAANPVDSKPNA